MKRLSKLKFLAGFICITSGFMNQGYATFGCTGGRGVNQYFCEGISAGCKWQSGRCFELPNDTCSVTNISDCGHAGVSNSRWCYQHDLPAVCSKHPQAR